MFCAIQTLDQFEKNELTKYLKGVILGCANIFVFGRSSLSDMEVFSAMAGVTEKPDEQKTIAETALSDDSPSLSYSSRETWMQKNVLEGIDIRMNDFQIVTLFTVRNGAPLPPIKAKVSFLKPSDWETREHLQKFLAVENQTRQRLTHLFRLLYFPVTHFYRQMNPIMPQCKVRRTSVLLLAANLLRFRGGIRIYL